MNRLHWPSGWGFNPHARVVVTVARTLITVSFHHSSFILITSLLDNTMMMDPIPLEILGDVLLCFLDGKSLSTLLLVSISSTIDRQTTLVPFVVSLIETRLQQCQQDAQEFANQTNLCDPLDLVWKLQKEFECHRNDIQQYQKTSSIRFLSKQLAFLDYFESSRRNNNNDDNDNDNNNKCALLEFPVWVGELQIPFLVDDDYDDDSDFAESNSSCSSSSSRRRSVRVRVWTPHWNPRLIRQWGTSWRSSREESTTTNLVLDVRNYRTVPPIGRVEGVNEAETAQLESLCNGGLTQPNHILVPRPATRRNRGTIHPFLATARQLQQNVPPYLRQHQDLYRLSDNNNNKPSRHGPTTMFPIWSDDGDRDNHPTRDDDDNDTEAVIDGMIGVMKRMGT